MLFADIILPLKPDILYTYKIPAALENKATPGMRAFVRFGKRKLYTGIIKNIHQKPPENIECKEIQNLPDEKPIVNKFQLDFWDWMADYFMCSHGEIYITALPSKLKIESKLFILYNGNFKSLTTGNEKSDDLLNIIRNQSTISFDELSKIVGKKNLMQHIRLLENTGAIILKDKLDEIRKVPANKYVVINPAFNNTQTIDDTLNKLSKAPKQKSLLLKFLELAGENVTGFKIKNKEFTGASDYSSMKSLIKKGILQYVEIENIPNISRKEKLILSIQLNSEQSDCLNNIKQIFQHKDVCLLYDTTLSKKTDIYFQLIAETIEKGQQVLYLLPEIVLTSQIVNRLQGIFGDRVEVYHNRINEKERINIYNRLLDDSDSSSGKIILGVKSSIFLPFTKLGLIIIDEEHENSYKQFDPAPRYHARDSAIILGLKHKAKILLGSATPSVESWANCKNDKFGLVTLGSQHEEIQTPRIMIANIREYKRKNKMRSVFTPVLIQEINNTISGDKQVILFQNKRGYASYMECSSCGWIPRCNACDVSLTYHKSNNSLVCHYCGFSRIVQLKCDACEDTKLVTRGFGTELIEDEIELIISGTNVARLDYDTSRKITSYRKILSDFNSGQTNILVGTQLVSKAVDFSNVGLIGIVDADQMLNYPDFRAHEKSFQLMMQLIRRIGSNNYRGKIIIQTSDPTNPIIKFVRDNNSEGFYKDQYIERQTFNYPPFVRMIKIILKHKSSEEINKAALMLAEKMKAVFGHRVLGPHDPVINRISSFYLKSIILKVEKKSSFEKVRVLLREILHDFRLSFPSSINITIDVDPV